MARTAILSHPDVAAAGAGHRTREEGWSPRLKLVCFLACASASWALFLAPFYFLG